MTNKIFKQYIGTLDSFKAWLGTGTNKTDLGDAIVFIHANDETDSKAEFTGWIYANGHYYQSGSTLTLTDVANLLASGSGVNVRTGEDNKIYFDAVVEKDIIIAGGPLASPAVVGVFADGKIPANMTIQEVLEKLFLREKWGRPTDPIYTFTTSVNAPTTDITETGRVKVGTAITCSTTVDTTQTTTQSATISGYAFGYSVDGTAIISKDTYTQSTTPSKTGSTSLSVTFSGLYNLNGTEKDSTTSGDATIVYVGEGEGTYSATYTGQGVTHGTFTTTDVYNVSNLKKINKDSKKTISQIGFSNSAAYNNGTLAAPTASSSKSVTGVWGYFYTTIGESLPDMTSNNIRTWTWVDTKPSEIKIGTGVYGIAIACPTGGSISNIEQDNPVSSFGTIQTKSVKVDAENNYKASHNYTVYYVKNDGPTTASQILAIDPVK